MKIGSAEMDEALEQPKREIALRKESMPFDPVPLPPTTGRGHKAHRISTEALRICMDALREGGINPETAKNLEALLLVLGQVLNSKIGGTPIENYPPNLNNPVCKIKRRLRQSRLIICENPDVYKSDLTPRKPPLRQRFLPGPALCGAKYRGRAFRATVSGYKKKDYESFHIIQRQGSKVELCQSSGVKVPKNIVEACKNGTGLCFDYDAAQRIDLEKKHDLEDIWQISKDLIRCTKCLPGEFIPELWKQSELGMISARNPPLQSLNKAWIPALRSCDGRQVWKLDFKEFFVILWLGKSAAERVDKKYSHYDDWARSIYILGDNPERGEVKIAFNAILNKRNYHGAKAGKKRDSFKKKQRNFAIYKQLVDTLADRFPTRIQRSANPLINPEAEKGYWNTKGAKVFHHCLSAGLEEINATKIGLPQYDSITLSFSNKAEFNRFRRAWTAASEDIQGYKLPSKPTRIA